MCLASSDDIIQTQQPDRKQLLSTQTKVKTRIQALILLGVPYQNRSTIEIMTLGSASHFHGYIRGPQADSGNAQN